MPGCRAKLGSRGSLAIGALLFLGQHRIHVRMRTRNHMDAHQLALNCFDGLRAGIDRCFDCGDVADDDRGYQRVANLRDRAGQFNVGGLQHCVGALNERNQPVCFE